MHLSRGNTQIHLHTTSPPNHIRPANATASTQPCARHTPVAFLTGMNANARSATAAAHPRPASSILRCRTAAAAGDGSGGVGRPSRLWNENKARIRTHRLSRCESTWPSRHCQSFLGWAPTKALADSSIHALSCGIECYLCKRPFGMGAGGGVSGCSVRKHACRSRAVPADTLTASGPSG